MGLYRTTALRRILNDKKIQSVTEDLEITLEMQKQDMSIDYTDSARSTTVAPTSLGIFWNQRIRWSMGRLHNLLSIHRNMLVGRRWLNLLLLYNLVVGYGGVALELAARCIAPLLLWFAPDKTYFIYNLLFYILFVLLIGAIQQGIALKFAFDHYNHKWLRFYTPLYSVLRLINVCTRFVCLIRYMAGEKGVWRKTEHLPPPYS